MNLKTAAPYFPNAPSPSSLHLDPQPSGKEIYEEEEKIARQVLGLLSKGYSMLRIARLGGVTTGSLYALLWRAGWETSADGSFQRRAAFKYDGSLPGWTDHYLSIMDNINEQRLRYRYGERCA